MFGDKAGRMIFKSDTKAKQNAFYALRGKRVIDNVLHSSHVLYLFLKKMY